MNPIEFRHVGLVVKDLELMKEFYISLGFSPYIELNEEGKFIENVIGLKDVKITTIKFKISDVPVLELIKYNQPPLIETADQTIPNKLGWSHLALTIQDFDEFQSNLENYGGSIDRVPMISDCGKFKVIYCSDPEGNILEIVEKI